jgi:predicted permease
VAKWIAARLLPRHQADRLLGALDDELTEFQDAERGRRRAGWWYGRQVLRSIRILRASNRDIAAPSSDRRSLSLLLGNLLRDFRFTARTLWRTPTFAVVAVMTLALGIGATTAIFSIVDAVLLRDLPYAEPDRIVRAWAHEDNGDIEDFSFRVAEYQELARRDGLFDVVAGEFPVSLPAVLPGFEPVEAPGRMVTPDFFRVFDTRPASGRMFTADEISAGNALVVVVSHGFWTRYLGADPGALDRPLELNGLPFTLIGILPEGYRHISGDVDLFVPYTLGTSGWVGRWLDLYGRVSTDTATAPLEDEISAVMATVSHADGRSAGWHASVETLHQLVVGDVRPMVWATFAAVGLVLLIACVNVANLMLARGALRTSEITLRAALGASRGRIVQQLLMESLLLAVVGGTLGIAAAWIGLRGLVALAPASVPRITDAVIDPTALAFTLVVMASAAAAFGLAPALRVTRRRDAATGQAGARATAREARFGGTLGGLVVAEIALALALLVGAGLMVRTFHALNAEEFGFERDSALSFRVNAPSARWPGRDGALGFFGQLRAGLLTIPEVTAVGAGSDLPFGGQGAVTTVTSEARARDGLAEGITALQRRATVGYFEALGTPLLAGRPFDERDGPETPPVVIVSATLAEQLFPGEDAVGRRVAFGSRPDGADWMTIVGVVEDVRFQRADQPDEPQIYQAHTQSAIREMSVVLRTTSDPTALLAPAKAALAAIDAKIPLSDPTSLDDVVSRAVAGTRFTMSLFSMFAVAALVLAAAGTYGVMAFAVGRRRRELGVRMALGARRIDVTRLVVREGMALVTAGLALGLGMALVLARTLDGFVYGVGTIDPGTYAIVTAVLAAAGLGACYLPARRGAKLDPATVLRSD